MEALGRRAAPLLVLVLLLVLAACGGSKAQTAGLDTSYRAPDSYSLQTLERQPYGCAKNNEQCAIAYLTKLTKHYGPHASLGVLGSLEQTGQIDPAFDTHQLAHLVGQTTAQSFGANKRAFNLCPQTFNYGCVHGFFIYVLGHTATPSKAASEACRSFPRAIITPCPTPCQQENVGTSGPPGLAELQITLAALLGVAVWPST